MTGVATPAVWRCAAPQSHRARWHSPGGRGGNGNGGGSEVGGEAWQECVEAPRVRTEDSRSFTAGAFSAPSPGGLGGLWQGRCVCGGSSAVMGVGTRGQGAPSSQEVLPTAALSVLASQGLQAHTRHNTLSHTQIRTHTCTQTHTHPHTQTHTGTHTHTRTHTPRHTQAHTSTCAYRRRCLALYRRSAAD